MRHASRKHGTMARQVNRIGTIIAELLSGSPDQTELATRDVPAIASTNGEWA